MADNTNAVGSNNTTSNTRNNRKTNKFTNGAITDSANQMLAFVRSAIQQEMRTKGLQTASSCELCSAVVSKVYDDGSVDVYFPPDKENLFTKISNQTSFNLQVGDCVELTLKNGSFSNCWVSARHNTQYNYSFRMNEIRKQEELDNYITEQKQVNELLIKQMSALSQSIFDLSVIVNDVRAQVDSMSTDINTLFSDVSNISRDINNIKSELQDIHSTLSNHQDQIDDLYDRLG